MTRNEPITPQERTLAGLIQDGLRLKGLSLDRLSQVTGISGRFLELLMNERYEKLPPAPYVRGYLVRIAEVLGLDGEELWREYLGGSALIRRSGSADTLPPNRFSIPKFNWKVVAWVLVGVIILGYIIFRIPALFDSYEFSVNIADNAVVREADFTIRGTVNENDQLTLNGEVLYPDAKGVFEKQVTLKEGWNTFEFAVKRFLGNEHTFTKQIFLEATGTVPVQ